MGEVFKQAVEDGRVLGAQLCVDGLAIDRYLASFGFAEPGSKKAVDENTLFCIGSCSKPIAAFIVLCLVDQKKLTLDDGVDKWLPEFGEPALALGGVTQAPTIRELLTHRGGIYSQRNQLNDAQLMAIRDFSIPLSRAVKIIAAQPLIAPPGERFAYSGAGYCVIGRAAERATDSSLEELLQTYVCDRLQLKRTTYFPNEHEANVAVAAIALKRKTGPYGRAPHTLGPRLRLALTGGSIYSTASELAKFADTVIRVGKDENDSLLSSGIADDLRREQYANQRYGLGWRLTIRDGEAIRMSHDGSLHGYHAWVSLDLENDTYVTAVWTDSDISRAGAGTLARQLRDFSAVH